MDTDTNITYYVPQGLGIQNLGVDSRGVHFSREFDTDLVAYSAFDKLSWEIAMAVCFSNIEFTVDHLNYLHHMTDFEWNFDVPCLDLHATRKKDGTDLVDPTLKKFYATILFPHYMDQYEDAQKAERRDILKFDIDPVIEIWRWHDEAPLGWQNISSGPEDGRTVWLRGRYPYQDSERRFVKQGSYDAGGYTEGWVDALLNIFYAHQWRPISKAIPALPCPIVAVILRIIHKTVVEFMNFQQMCPKPFSHS